MLTNLDLRPTLLQSLSTGVFGIDLILTSNYRDTNPSMTIPTYPLFVQSVVSTPEQPDRVMIAGLKSG